VLQRIKTIRSKDLSEQTYKIVLSSDYFLKLENMKEESSVIVDQNASVNMYFNLVLTACRTLGVCVRKIG